MHAPLTKEQMEIRALRERVNDLQFEVRRLRRQLGEDASVCPMDWKLTRQESKLLSALFSSPDGFRANELLHAALYAGKDVQCEHLVARTMVRLRRKVASHGVEILTRHGFGYELPKASRAVIMAARAERAAI